MKILTVILSDKEQELERNFTTLGFEKANTTKNIIVKNIIVDDLKKNELCTQILNNSNAFESYMFDLSINSHIGQQFGRKFALPTVRISSMSEKTKSNNQTNDAWTLLTVEEKEFLISVLTIPAILTNTVTDISRKFSYTKIILIYDRYFGKH